MMYIATGDGDANDTYSVGILKSTNSGGTWVATGLSWNINQQRTIRRLIINPSTPDILVAATSNGIYRTTDGGDHWTRSTVPSGTWAYGARFFDEKNAVAVGEYGNIASDTKLLEQMKKDDPLAAAVLQTQVEATDKLTGNWPLANDARVKEAFYPELQNAVLGRKPAAQALKDAAAKVDRVLGQ